jgi:hypothetical protein
MLIVTRFIVDNAWKIALLLFALGGAWTSQVSALSSKADKSTIDSIFVELRAQRAENQRNFKTVKTLLCRRDSSDSWCAKEQN